MKRRHREKREGRREGEEGKDKGQREVGWKICGREVSEGMAGGGGKEGRGG